MNETIKTRDNKDESSRSLIIKNEQYQKILDSKSKQEEKELQELEKKLLVSQAKTIVTAVPLVIAGTILKELTSSKKEEITIETENKKEPIKVSITTKKYGKTQEKPSQQEIELLEESDKKDYIVEKVEQNYIPLPSTEFTSVKNLEILKEYEIINRYESKLKELKIDLKKIIFEYNIIVEEYDNVYESKRLEELLDKLNIIIKKIDKLKKALEIPNRKDYDQNYIYNLINDYLTEFAQNKIVEDIKDSELYILISNKLEELDRRKEELKQDLTAKIESVSLDEEGLDKLKERYDVFDNFNNSLLHFQKDQDALTKDLEQKIKNAVTEQEKVETKIRFLQNQSSLLLSLMLPQLLIPGTKSAGRLAIAAACLVRLMKNNFRTNVTTKRYKVISVTDYTQDITNSIKDIDKSILLLKRSKKELLLLIEKFKKDYQIYFGKSKECDKLLENLQECIFSLEEKEEEMQQLRLEQEKNLEHNNEKIKQMSKYEII